MTERLLVFRQKEPLTKPIVPKRDLIVNIFAKAEGQVSIEDIFKIEAIGSERLKSRVKDIINFTEKVSRKKYKGSGGAGGWRRKVSTHDEIKTEFGCDHMGCDICNHRKITSFVQPRRKDLLKVS